ncbi:Lrp/AsnC family transcriptional regulator [Algirhabdus cladophorae]|uniref:Lrp/AsnC family transcriptional regulator n=1 Tax=Algirhabdus cladophorae TaxID=3377108 RepID=UPI003B846C30
MMEITLQDRRLISALRKDGRASITTLAASLGLSRATVQNRLERLTRSGVISRFTIDLDPSADVEAVRAVMMIEVEGTLARPVIKALRRLPEVASLYNTNGGWDFVAQIEAASLADFDRVLREVRLIKGVLKSESNLLLSPAGL